MWTIEPTEEYRRRYRKWPKKYGRELLAVHNNLDTFVKAIQSGQKPGTVRFGFLHPEPSGVLAIDQKGGGPHLMETRLYIYPDEGLECVFVITLGDKNSQTKDIRFCTEFVDSVRKEAGQYPNLHEKNDAQE